MVLLAFSLQDQVEKYGAYVGIAAFFGLAVLSLLYFAQAREVKRLREWARRAPELAAEFERMLAEGVLREAEPASQPVAQPQVSPQPQPQPAAAAANGAVELKPAELAALAFARAAGVREPHEPRPHPAPAPTPAAPTAAAAPAATVAAPAPPTQVAALAPGANGGGSGSAPPKPPPATPAARRPEPAPLPPRRTAPPSRRPASPPPRRESNVRAVVLTAVIGLLVLAGTAFAVTSMLGDDEQPAAPPPVATVPPEEATPEATAEPVTKENALVMVFNGTSITGLAGQYEAQLEQEGYNPDNVVAATLAEAEQRQTSTVMYRGARSRQAARDVAAAIGIEQVERLDASIQAALADLPQDQQKNWNVVVIVGVDKSTS